jgi:hypothetical protein
MGFFSEGAKAALKGRASAEGVQYLIAFVIICVNTQIEICGCSRGSRTPSLPSRCLERERVDFLDFCRVCRYEVLGIFPIRARLPWSLHPDAPLFERPSRGHNSVAN